MILSPRPGLTPAVEADPLSDTRHSTNPPNVSKRPAYFQDRTLLFRTAAKSIGVLSRLRSRAITQAAVQIKKKNSHDRIKMIGSFSEKDFAFERIQTNARPHIVPEK
jgi:hypothetical protein